MDENEDIWSEDELTDDEVVIEEDPYQSSINFDDEEEYEYEDEEDDDIRMLRQDPEVSAWLPSSTSSSSSSGGFSGIFKNEGARTGQPTNLNSSAIGRGQMIKGTRIAMYRKLGITDINTAEQKFKTDPDFEMQVLNAYKDELDARIPSNVQGRDREYMLAKGWYTGNPFYNDNEVPGRSAGNKLTAGEYARRATRAYGGPAEMEVDNLAKSYLDKVSDSAVEDYLMDEGIDVEATDPDSDNGKLASGVNAVTEGIGKFQNFRDKIKSITNGISQSTSEAIDFQSELAGIQRNAVSLRKFNAQKNKKLYSAANTNLNQPLIYT